MHVLYNITIQTLLFSCFYLQDFNILVCRAEAKQIDTTNYIHYYYQ